MTNRRFFFIGLGLCVLLPVQALAEPLYDRIKEQVIRDLAHGDIDDEVNDFIRATFRNQHELSREEVQQILDGDWGTACGNRPSGDQLKNQGVCLELVERITTLAEHEQATRAFGRTLQATASSYEAALSTLPRKTNRILSDLRGILNIWTAGTEKVNSTYSLLSTVTISDETFKPLIENIADALNELNPEEQTAAVWRYQSGMRLVRGERTPTYPAPYVPENSGAGTERQFLFKRWTDVETALKELWSKILTYDFDRPPQKGETLYVIFPEKFLSEMPGNIELWGRLYGEDDPNRPQSDAGLQWDIALETVQPSLLTEGEEDRNAIPGGYYPPEPTYFEEGNAELLELDGRTLCTHASAFGGYLCRPFQLISQSDRCPPEKDAPPPPPDTINIVTCTKTGSLRFTSGGADVCREIEWKPDKPFNPSTQCKLVVGCAPDCTVKAGNSATTYPKDANGVITVCSLEKSPDILNSYLLYHELTHAYQLCNKPIGFSYKETPSGASKEEAKIIREENTSLCCRMEGEAYRVQCNMMERDGVFKGMAPVDGIPFNAETCAEAATHGSCGVRDGFNGCYTSRTYSETFVNALLNVKNNPAKVPDTCSESLDPKTMDQRVKALKELIERRDDVCMPGQVNNYPNRIGNNMCFIGQCVEQSVETHRIAGGSVPVNVGGEIAPWDNPVSGSPLGNAVVNPPISQGRFPTYRPHLLVRSMETALCQLVGLPPLQPPIRCIIEASRQLQTLQTTPADTALGIVNQLAEEELSAKDILALTPAVASRAGTNLYAVYLRDATRSFSDILSMAAKLLEELSKINFPTEMCPITPGLP